MRRGKCVIEVWRGSQSLTVNEETAQGSRLYVGYVDGQHRLVAATREAAMRGLLRSRPLGPTREQITGTVL